MLQQEMNDDASKFYKLLFFRALYFLAYSNFIRHPFGNGQSFPEYVNLHFFQTFESDSGVTSLDSDELFTFTSIVRTPATVTDWPWTELA